ncbi:MAG: sn-glycerol-3-phosphate ABC transporter ATP-binding protein UgpC [Azospirillaceae bacterium]|nr:sn-glycerol-3-phosphate ABC transporter ATP-binding protein UgpC [Azospirillaceae bacterium]
MAEISLRHVAKSYGRTPVVHAIDLEVAAGEFIVILGPSGCGKSTLLRMIAGLEAITAGEIAIGGRVVNDLEPRERGCAMVFQNYALYPHMTVADNIGYALKVAGVAKAERLARIEKVADALGLRDLLGRRPAQLSGGQRQRVAMGRAMIREPAVFLFDEPLSNLDAELRVRMRVEIRKLHDRLGATSIFVTHDQVEAMTLADRIVVLHGGRVEQIGTPYAIYHQPASHFVAGFIGSPAMNRLDGRVGPAATVVFADGTTIAVPDLDLPEGQAVTLGIRPEDLRVGSEAPEDGIRHRLAIDFVEHLGPAALVHGRFAGHDFVASVPRHIAFTVVEGLTFTMPVETMHLFDSTTGRRIGIDAARE